MTIIILLVRFIIWDCNSPPQIFIYTVTSYSDVLSNADLDTYIISSTELCGSDDQVIQGIKPRVVMKLHM
jgi:hypothetical protein